MKKVLKFPLKITDDQTVVMPEGSQILTVQTQHDTVTIWALCPETLKKQPRRIEIFGTGHPIPNGNRTYLGTAITQGGSLVWHVFERA